MKYTRIDPTNNHNESLLEQLVKWHNMTPKLWIKDYKPTAEDLKETIKRIVETEKSDLYLGIAQDDQDEPVGFIWAYRKSDDDKNVMIMSLHVEPEYRNQGIASQLKQNLESWCKEIGVQSVETTVHFDNKNMLELNLKLGYNAGMVCMTKKL